MTTAETLLDQGFEQHQRGRFMEAESLYRKLLMHQPHHVDGLHLLGLVHHQTGRVADAISLIEQAIAAKGVPCPILLTNLGAAYQECGQWPRAEECYRQAILLDKTYINAHQNLCRLLTMQGKTQLAASAWAGFGNLMLDSGKAAEALVHFRLAQELFPDQPSVLHDLATALARLNRLDESVSAYRAALAKDNRSAMAWNNLGWVLLQLGQSQQAIDKFHKAIALAPDYAEAHMCLGIALLRSGQYERGWIEYEWRWKSSAKQFVRAQPQPLPRWDGQPLNGRKLFIESEQGLGDVLQFVRYVELLYRQGEQVCFQCPKPLQPLLRSCSSFADTICSSEQSVQCDCYVPLLSLPYLLGSQVESVPTNVPYLRVPEDRIQQWRTKLKSPTNFRIGIVWQGNTAYNDDQQRSFSVQKYGPLSHLPGVELICLQKGAGTEQLAKIPFRVKQLGEEFDTVGPFLDTAAVMKNLDLVIAPNSSLAHLAGALGVPVWVMLSAYATDWRWLDGQTQSPWYPSLRLYRQQTPGDWDETFNRVIADVAKLIENKS